MDTQLTVELPGTLLLATVGRRYNASPPRRAGGVWLDPQIEQLTGRLAQRIADECDQVARTREALEAAAGELRNVQAELLAQAEQQVVALAVDIARKVLAQEIDAGKYSVDPIVAEALAGVQECKDIVVHLNPEDLARCEQASGPAPKGQSPMRFVADDTVPPAGCKLETVEGTVVSSVDKSVDRIADALTSSE